MRDYQFDDTGRLASITTPCTGGAQPSTPLETYTYAANDPALVVGIDKNQLTSTACGSASDATNLSITYAQGAGQEGAATAITEDPGAIGGPTSTLNLQQDQNNQLQTITNTAAPQNSQSIQRTADGTRTADVTPQGTVTYDYAQGSETVSGTQEASEDEPQGTLTDPNGLTIGILRITPTDSQYLISDPQNTPLLITDRSGYITETHDYDAYGQPETLLTTTNTTTPTTLGYTGVRTDPTTGLIDNQARTYNPTTRTWLTTDEYRSLSSDRELSEDISDQQRISYGGYNPVSNTDPTGHYTYPFFSDWDSWCDDHGRVLCDVLTGVTAKSFVATAFFGMNPARKDGFTNTFRHTYWSTSLVIALRALGKSKSRSRALARSWTNVHEAARSDGADDTYVDKRNNKRGFTIGNSLWKSADHGDLIKDLWLGRSTTIAKQIGRDTHKRRLWIWKDGHDPRKTRPGDAPTRFCLQVLGCS